MQLAKSPTGLQRRHEYVKAIGTEPDQVPVVTDSVWSTTLVPAGRIGGVAVPFGASRTTGAVTSEFCWVLPPESVAVTPTRSRKSLSAGVGVYVDSVAPVMFAHVPLTGSPASHRFHWNAYVIGKLPLHEPMFATRRCPTIGEESPLVSVIVG